MKVVIAGATGRMGRMLVEAVTAAPDLSLSGALDMPSSPGIGTDPAAFLGRSSGVLITADLDAGLSGAFGVGTGEGNLGGGSLVERNLNRWTVAFGILFAVNTIVLLKI